MKIKILSLVLVTMAALGLAVLPQARVFADKDIDILASDYGYGEYTVMVRGTGWEGVYDEDYVTFYYYPIYAEATKNDDIEGFDLDLSYNADDGTEDTGEVARIIVNVYDNDGNLIKELSPIEVFPPTTHVELPFGQYGLETGTYRIAVSAYNRDGEELYKPYVIEVYYEAEVIPTPDTGGLFKNLNISKTDYLITGLMIFGLVAVCGVVFIIRNDKKKVSRKQAYKRRK